jgi:tRNA pseudouridine synthase B-like protein
MAEMLPRLPVVTLTPDGVRRARNGCDLDPAAAGPESALARLVDADGRLIGIGRYVAARRVLHPSVIVM